MLDVYVCGEKSTAPSCPIGNLSPLIGAVQIEAGRRGRELSLDNIKMEFDHEDKLISFAIDPDPFDKAGKIRKMIDDIKTRPRINIYRRKTNEQLIYNTVRLLANGYENSAARDQWNELSSRVGEDMAGKLIAKARANKKNKKKIVSQDIIDTLVTIRKAA